MIWQCFECQRLFDEHDGAMVITTNLSGFVPTMNDMYIFKCKGCLSQKARDRIDEIQSKQNATNKKNKPK